MGQRHEEITQNVAERLCGEVARRDEARIARRLQRTHLVDGGYRLDEGAVWDDFCHCLDQVGVRAWLAEVHGAAIQRAMVPFVPYGWRYSLKTRFGMERIKARPALLCREEALMPWVGFKAQQVRAGVCQRGATTRPGKRLPGPIGAETLAKNIVTWNVWALAVVFKGAIGALAKAGVLEAQVPGLADGTALETTARATGCGQVTRQVRLEAQQGRMREIEVTVDGWQVRLLIDAATNMPLAAKVGQMHEPAALWPRALVTQARAHLAAAAHRQQGVFEQAVLAGTDRWWLAQQGSTLVVPAHDHLAVTTDARAQAAAGAGITGGHRVQTVRHGQGRQAWTERVETAVVGITGLPTDDPYGTVEHGRHANRRDCQAHPLNAVVVRTWPGKDQGPGGNTAFRTNASVETPWRPVDDDDDRRLSAHGWITKAKQPWALGHPPPTTGRAGRVPVVFTLRLFALATASRQPCEREATSGEPVGWQRWRRLLLEQTRDHVMGFAQGGYGIVHLAEYSLRLGVRLKDKPPGIGTDHDMLPKYRLTSQA